MTLIIYGVTAIKVLGSVIFPIFPLNLFFLQRLGMTHLYMENLHISNDGIIIILEQQ